MSEVILRFAEPWLNGPDGSINPNALRFAMTVWNVSLLPKNEQVAALKTLVNLLPEGEQDARRELVAASAVLLARKQPYCVDNKGVILDYQITHSGDRRHLDVVSTLGKDYNPDL